MGGVKWIQIYRVYWRETCCTTILAIGVCKPTIPVNFGIVLFSRPRKCKPSSAIGVL
ncbi:hypothetical protein PEX2_099050 [Penicillium expansum]|uniref:Uncharacterized protein n=1 Tax=Penicillium expansum TaxID=27334 RepID=A0A0A2JAB6_PENEN|nr:hypothetical protein PEX2_099050 [Penicillium expansum]KGO51731.1 hypothetical protein PEX2_099050 [Penicillium expansum]